jgi:hypothetical protein
MGIAARNWKHFALAIVACFAAAVANAQDSQQDLNVVSVKITVGGRVPFEAFLIKYRDAVEKRGDERFWDVSTNAMGPVTEYKITSVLASVDEMDTPADPLAAMIESAFTSEQAEAVATSLEGVVAETDHRAWIALPELSRPLESDAPPAGFTVIFLDIKPGAKSTFEAYARRQVEASTKLDDGNWQLAIGAPGAPSDYLYTYPFYTWAELDKPEGLPLRERLIAVFGETEGAKMSAEGIASMEKITTELIRTRPDLSRVRAD